MKHPVQLIRIKLQYDIDFACDAMLRLYNRQTTDEQSAEKTLHKNEIGFNNADSIILTPICESLRHEQRISEEDKFQITERMSKYARQVTDLFESHELDLE